MATATDGPGDRAIVVGIGRYPRFGPDAASPNDLLGPVADARDMADWLVDVAKAGVTLITSDGDGSENWTAEDLRPTETDISATFDPFLLSAGARVANRLYVYFAGHGFAPDPRSRSLILANALGTAKVPNFHAPAWIDWFASQYHFDELVLWMDCCATQTFDYAAGVPPMPRTAARSGPPAKVFMAFGSGVGRSAFEGPIGPDNQVRGLFTDRLLRGLRGAAAHENGEVRSADLKKYLYNGSSGSGDAPVERPVVEPVIPQDDDMLFATAPRGAVYSIAARASNGTPLTDGSPVDLLDGRFDKIGEAPVAGGRVEFRLTPGLYKLSGPGLERILDIGAGSPPRLD
ncbi:MAG TPA: hypothetical protein VF605_13580 [Allosphingosinicella sp.]|jgi:hypothetical protein